MFEAVFAVCLAGGAICRDTLLPGYEAATQSDCEVRLAANPQEGARCQRSGPALAMQEIAPGIFVHEGAIEEPNPENAGDVSNLGFVVGEDAVAVIDTGGSRAVGEALWRAIRTETDLPVRYVILTHMHPDHVFGAEVFPGAKVVGNAELARALADRAENYLESFTALIGPKRFLGTEAVAPGVPVADRLTIDLGGRALDLRAWPMAHTPTDLTVTDLETGTFFAGDLVFDRHAPALDGSLNGWEAVLDSLAAEHFARMVPGHGGPVLPWPDGAAALRQYLSVLEADTRAALDKGLRIGEAAETVATEEAPNWQLFDAYNARNATVAFTELEWE